MKVWIIEHKILSYLGTLMDRLATREHDDDGCIYGMFFYNKDAAESYIEKHLGKDFYRAVEKKMAEANNGGII